MKKIKILPLLKLTVISALALSACYIAFAVPEAVESSTPTVETIKAEQINYSPAVSANGSIVKQRDRWLAIVAVNEGDISAVELGQSVRLSGAALAEGVYKGSVIAVADTAYTMQSSSAAEIVVDVTVEIEEGDVSLLRSGYSVTAELQTGDERTVNMLPYSVICQDDIGEYIFILQNNTAVRRDIVTGIELADKTEIISGLNDGDLVVSEPNQVSDGGRVREAVELR